MVLATSMFLVVGGCEGTATICDESIASGIQLTVKNETGEYICDQVIAVVFEGNYTDTLRGSSWNEAGELISLSGADERAGNYGLVITSSAYKTYSENNIIIMDGTCHVHTKEFSVTLKLK